MSAHIIEGKTFDEERALYNSCGVELHRCAFAGEADGESALKCSRDVVVSDTLCALRYPFWHNEHLAIVRCDMTESCRAALWYTSDVSIADSKLHGIKALRECADVHITDCDVMSPEFGWFCRDVDIRRSKIASEYFLLRSSNVHLVDIILDGKYSLQYVTDAVIEGCILNTKDCLWHAQNVVVRSCEVNGEYLGWYSDGVTFEDCTLRGTQPLCCCRNLRLINCRMENACLAFEKSDVEADIIGRIESVKNPASGKVVCDEVGNIIIDEEGANGIVAIRRGNSGSAVNE